MVDAADTVYFMARTLGEIIHGKGKHLQIDCYTDNMSLNEAVHSTNTVLEKRLLTDLSILREMVERKEITISWIESEKQFANCLTKRGASCDTLINVVQSGKLTVLC